MRRIPFALSLVSLLASAPLWAQSTSRVSVTSAGVQAHGDSLEPGISADGRFVVYSSAASDLVPGDQNGFLDIFAHDRMDGSTRLVSLDPSGAQFDGNAGAAALSGDGSAVAFEVWTVPMPGYNQTGLYVRDLVSGSTDPMIAGHGYGGHFDPAMSHDGSLVVYAFQEDPFSPLSYQVLVFDRASGTSSVASVDSAGNPGSGPSTNPALSADGRFVAFESQAADLVGGDTNGWGDVFVHDRQSGATVRVSVSSSGAQVDGPSRRPAISADGRYVAFESGADDLVPGDANQSQDIFVHDRQSGRTVLASLSSTGLQSDQQSSTPSVSSDGPRVLFWSWASNLVPGDTNGVSDIFLRDLAAGTTVRLSVDSAGTQSNGQSLSSLRSLSADGRRAVFYSQADNLVAGDTNGEFDVFVHDLTIACPPLATYCTAKPNSQGCTPEIGASGLPTLSGPDAFFVVAEDVLGQKSGMLFWGLAPAAIPFAGGTLCVRSPVRRTPLQDSGGSAQPACDGTYSFHFSQAYMSASQIAPGTTVHAQFWSRDPGFAPPQNVGLTDALSFTACP